MSDDVWQTPSETISSEERQYEGSPELDPHFRQQIEQVMNQEEVLVVGDGVALLTTPDDSVLVCTNPPSGVLPISSPPFRIVFLPWMPLTQGDIEVLSATALSISTSSDLDSKLSALHFCHAVLLRDFPPDVLLQRPALTKCLLQCLEDPIWQLQLAALQCLETLTSSLLNKIKVYLQPKYSQNTANRSSSNDNGHRLSRRYHQPIDMQLDHVFSEIPFEEVDEIAYPTLSKEQLSVQQYICQLMTSPLATSVIFASQRSSVRSVAMKILSSVLQILEISVDLELMWLTYRNDVNELDDTEAVIIIDEAVQYLVNSVKVSVEGISQCVISSHEDRWLCESMKVIKHHCSVFNQSAQCLTAWLHSLTNAAQKTVITSSLSQIVSESVAEAIVLVICDIGNILQLLPPQVTSNHSAHHLSSISNKTLDFLWMRKDITGAYRSDVEKLVSLLTLLSEVDPHANVQVSAILSVCSFLQSSVVFLQCTSKNFDEFLSLGRNSLPVLPLHLSEVLFTKLIEGLCKQFPKSSPSQKTEAKNLLLDLLFVEKDPEYFISQSACSVSLKLRKIHSLLLSTIGVSASASTCSTQCQSSRCLLLLQREVLCALIHLSSTVNSIRPVLASQQSQHSPVEILSMLFTSELTMGANLFSTLCRNVLPILPDVMLLTDEPDLSESIDRILPREEEDWRLKLDLICSLQGLFHLSESVRRLSLLKSLTSLSLDESHSPLISLQSSNGSAVDHNAFVLSSSVNLYLNYRLVGIQPDQIIRLSKLLEDGDTGDEGGASDSSVANAVWRQLAFLTQHPGNVDVLTTITAITYYKRALKEMTLSVVGPRGFTLADIGPCLEVMKNIVVYNSRSLDTLSRDFTFIKLLARIVLSCTHDSNIKREGSTLLFMLLMHPLIEYHSEKTIDEHESEARLVEAMRDLSVDDDESNNSPEVDPLVPYVPKLLGMKLLVPFFFKYQNSKFFIRELVGNCRFVVQSILPPHLAPSPEFSDDISRRESQNDFLDNCKSAYRVCELLEQDGGCAEQIHSLLKMVWASSASGGASKFKPEVDYSSQFSEFVKMSDREKILFQCSFPATISRKLLSEIENCTLAKDLKHLVCLLENTLSCHLEEAKKLPDEDFSSLLFSDVWWVTFGKYLQKEPRGLSEQQLYSHIVNTLYLVLRSCDSVISRERKLEEKRGAKAEEKRGAPQLYQEICALIHLKESPLIATLTNTGTHDWTDQHQNDSESSKTNPTSQALDQLTFRVFSSLTRLLSLLPKISLHYQIKTGIHFSNSTHKLLPKQMVSILDSIVKAFDPVLTKSCQKNPFCLAVLCNTSACLVQFSSSGWFGLCPDHCNSSVILSQAIKILEVLSVGRGKSADAFLGRFVSLNCSSSVAYILSNCRNVHDILPSLSTCSSKSHSIPWIPTLLSYRDCGVSWGGWKALSKLAEEPSTLEWLVTSKQGTVDLWHAILSCLVSLDRSCVERTVAFRTTSLILANIGKVSDSNDSTVEVKTPLVTDTVNNESVWGSEALIILFSLHEVYRSIRHTLRCTLFVDCADIRTTKREAVVTPSLLSAIFSVLLELIKLDAEHIVKILFEEDLIPMVIRQLSKISQHIKIQHSDHEMVCSDVSEALACGVSVITAVVADILSSDGDSLEIIKLARDTALIDALVKSLSSPAALSDMACTQCFTLLSYLVDTKTLLRHQGKRVSREPTCYWGCLHLTNILETNPTAFLRCVVRALHCTNPSDLQLSKAVTTFLTLYLHGLMDHCDQEVETENIPLYVVSNLLMTPVVLTANKEVSPGYEIFRHLVELVKSSGPKLYPKKMTSELISNGKQKSKKVNGVNKNMVNTRKSLSLDDRTLDACYVECMSMLAFVSKKARYAGFHLREKLLPHLLRPMEDLPDLLQDKGVHFTSNMLNKKDLKPKVLEVCRNLRLLTNLVCERNTPPCTEESAGITPRDLTALCEVVLPLLHPLWLPSLYTPWLLQHILCFVVTASQHQNVCGLLLRTTPLPGSLLSSQKSTKPLLSCIAHSATQNLTAIASGRQSVTSTRTNGVSSHLVAPSSLRGCNTTLLGGSVAVPVDSCYLCLCVLANVATNQDCAATLAKSGVIPVVLTIIGGNTQCRMPLELSLACVKVMTVMSFNSSVHSVIVKFPDWVSCLHRALLHLPSTRGSPAELSLHVLRVLVNLASVPSAVSSLVNHDELLPTLVQSLSDCSRVEAAMGSLCTPLTAEHTLLVLLWTFSSQGHKAITVMRQLPLRPVLSYLDAVLEGTSREVTVLLSLLDC